MTNTNLIILGAFAVAEIYFLIQIIRKPKYWPFRVPYALGWSIVEEKEERKQEVFRRNGGKA